MGWLAEYTRFIGIMLGAMVAGVLNAGLMVVIIAWSWGGYRDLILLISIGGFAAVPVFHFLNQRFGTRQVKWWASASIYLAYSGLLLSAAPTLHRMGWSFEFNIHKVFLSFYSVFFLIYILFPRKSPAIGKADLSGVSG